MVARAEVVDLETKRPVKKVKKTKAEGGTNSPKRPKRKTLAQYDKQIEDLQKNSAKVAWEIGQLLSEVNERGLWQEGGYKSFAEYVSHRHKFTKQTARSFIAISKTFSKEEAGELNRGALRLLVTIEDDDVRAGLAKWVREEKPSHRELADAVKAKRAEAGLNTSRAGFEGTILVNTRLKPGVIAEGGWRNRKATKTKPAARVGKFELGDNEFVVEDLGDEGFTVHLIDPEG